MPPLKSYLSTAPGPLKILKNSNYLKYFGGQLISMSGTWMQSVAQSWLVYRLSHSGTWLGVVMFAGQAPAFLMAPIAGVVADHGDRRKILTIVQVVAMVQALVLAALVFSGTVQLWHVVVLAAGLGIVSAFDMTTRHAFAVDMVGKADLSQAIALNSVLINITRVIGPMLAGFALKLGEAWCFTLNGISYIPVIWGLLAMTLTKHAPRKLDKSVRRDIVEGMAYARRIPIIFRILVLSTFVCAIACPPVALLPVFAAKVLAGGSDTFAWLTGMQGLGAVTGALLFSGESNLHKIRRKLISDIIFWGVGLMTLGLSKNLWLSFGAMFTIGYFMMSVFPTMNNAIQQIVEDHMRGRVMSLYTMTFLGTVPIGSLLIGALSDRITAPWAVAGAGVLTVALGMALAFRNLIRHRLKIVDEGVRGLNVQ